MPGRNRGALPLALLIFAVLVAGVVVLVMDVGGEKRMEQAGDDPSVTVPPSVPVTPTTPPETPDTSVSPETPESPESPDTSPTSETPETPEPTTTTPETPEPTESPETPEPTPTETNGGGGGGNNNGGELPRTGGPVLPWFIGGMLMLAGSAGVWRLRRVPR